MLTPSSVRRIWLLGPRRMAPARRSRTASIRLRTWFSVERPRSRTNSGTVYTGFTPFSLVLDKGNPGRGGRQVAGGR